MSSSKVFRFHPPCRFALVVLCLAFGAGIAHGTAPQTPADHSVSAERLLREGLQAYRGQQLEQALIKLRQSHQLAPQNQRVRLILGLMLYENDPASLEAQQLMESVAPQFPDNLELRVKLLDSYLRLKNETKVDSFLRTLQPVMSGNTRFAFDVIYTLVRYAQIATAENLLNGLAGRLQTKSPAAAAPGDSPSPAPQARARGEGEIHFVRGMIAASRGRRAEAVGQFQAADRKDFPARDSLQMQMLAEALFRLEEYPLAIQAYEEYLKYFPQDAAARMKLALGYYSNASFADAKNNFGLVLQQAPQTDEVRLYLGLTLLQLKSNEEARRYFQDELKVNPQSYQAMTELGYLDYLGGDNESCRQWLEKAQALNPEWVETNLVYGLLYNRLGQFDRAVAHLERAVKEKPNYYKAHYQLSLAYRRLGNEPKAKEHSAIYDRLLADEKSRQLGGRPDKN